MPKEKISCIQFILVLAFSIPCRLSIEGIPYMKVNWADYVSNNRHSPTKKALL